jgi:hypothetical protein
VARGWVWLYTRGLPAEVADRRTGELAADVHDQTAFERSVGGGGASRAVTWRTIRGVPADLAWRIDTGWHIAEHVTGDDAVRLGRSAHRRGLALAIGSACFLFWLVGALGLVGTEGDRADLMYLGVILIGVVGTAISRLRSRGMARTLAAMALAIATAMVVVFAAGLIPDYNTAGEIVGLHAMFIALFGAAAWLFRRAAVLRPSARS